MLERLTATWRRATACAVALALAAAAAGCATATDGSDRAERRGTATVTRVTDGDTLRLTGLGATRLIGVDTPEVHGGAECYGREASAFAERHVPPGTRVSYELGVDPRDPYDRALAYVWLPDGRFLNLMLVEQGYAQVLTVPPNVDHARRFVAAQRRARGAERGLWSPSAC